MRLRQNRVPSFFNLSMVDVLCCALGCVIMLWLINLHRANQTQAVVEDTKTRLIDSELQNQQTTEMLEYAREQRDHASYMLTELDNHITTLESERKQANTRIALQNSQIEDLDGKVKSALSQIALLQGQLDTSKKTLASARKENDDLNTQLVKMLANLTVLETQSKKVPTLQKELKTSAEELALLKAMLLKQKTELASQKTELEKTQENLTLALAAKRDLTAKLETSSTQLITKDKALDQALIYKEKWELAEKKILEMEKTLQATKTELAKTNRQWLNTKDTNKTLQTQVVRLQADAANRFAGITLAGKRVVFLVDRSGSMLESAEKVPSPTKWSEVHKTVVKVMKSLPNLEKFQLVVFAAGAEFPLGSPGDWLDYDPETTPAKVLTALGDPKLTPFGGTNMYSGLEAAFALRTKGLDNVYILSDGLPSLGPGVSPDLLNTLTDVQKGQMLGGHIRQKLTNEWNRPVGNQRPVRVNAIGFFYDSPDVGAFLWALSRENRGSFVGMAH